MKSLVEMNSTVTRTTENNKINNVTVYKDQNEDETKCSQNPEVVEIVAQESNEMRYTNIFDNMENNKSQEENFIKEEIVSNIIDDEIKFEFVGVTVKEETEDNYDVIDEKSEIYNDAFLNKTENIEESTSKSGSGSEDKKSHKCNECNKSFTFRSHLLRHVLCHTGEKPFQCDVCDKTFSEKCILVRHKRLHTGEKPYKCEMCNKKFSQKCQLVTHKRRHTGETPYKCDVCDRAFKLKSCLVAHKLCHTGGKPYKCDVCDRAFKLKSCLVAHKLYHTGDKPYQCDVCDKAFNWKSSLVRHKGCHIGKNCKSAS